MMMNPVNEQASPNSRMDAIIDEIQGQRVTRSPEELHSMFQLICYCGLGLYCLDQILPRETVKMGKRNRPELRPEFDLNAYLDRLLSLFSSDDEPKKNLVSATRAAGERIKALRERNNWRDVHVLADSIVNNPENGQRCEGI